MYKDGFSIKWLICHKTKPNQTKPFVYTQSNGQRVLFLTIRFNINRLFAHLLNITFMFDPYNGPYEVLPLRVRVDMEAMTMKKYSILPNAPEPLDDLISYRDIHWEESYPSAVGVFYGPSQLGRCSTLKS